MTVGADRLWQEIGFLAYYLHWSMDDLMQLPHSVRRRLLNEVSTLNRAESGTS